MPVRISGKFAIFGAAALLSLLLSGTGVYDRAAALHRERVEAGRMKNVVLLTPDRPQPTAPPTATEPPEAEPVAEAAALPEATGAPEEEPEILSSVMDSSPSADIRPTTISGGLKLKNETGYTVDVEQILQEGPQLRLPAEGPQILIIHTHGSEAYMPAGLDRYEANDTNRTEDTQFNIIRVGDELAQQLTEAGLTVLHDREIYDYPSYTGSYTRSGRAVEHYLTEYPGIAVVLDVHRDALGADGVVYKTMAEEDGVVASQVMLLVGSDESGLEHPHWQGNLALALYLQEAVGRRHPTLMRPVSLVPQRYNQHLTPGSLIVEVGSSGNTLQEALAAIRLFADAAAPALLELVETAGSAEAGAGSG